MTDDKDYAVCPFDKSHVILLTRMTYHLTRCRRQHPDIKLETCPFNSTHLLPKEKFNEHCLTCPNRAAFENFRTRDMPEKLPAFLDAPPFEEVPSTESWDDCDAPTYNAKKHAATAPVLRLMQGGTPSERKQFRQQEHKRLNDLRKANADKSKTEE